MRLALHSSYLNLWSRIPTYVKKYSWQLAGWQAGKHCRLTFCPGTMFLLKQQLWSAYLSLRGGRKLVRTARGSQEAGFTQPLRDKFALLSTKNIHDKLSMCLRAHKRGSVNSVFQVPYWSDDKSRKMRSYTYAPLMDVIKTLYRVKDLGKQEQLLLLGR